MGFAPAFAPLFGAAGSGAAAGGAATAASTAALTSVPIDASLAGASTAATGAAASAAGGAGAAAAGAGTAAGAAALKTAAQLGGSVLLAQSLKPPKLPGPPQPPALASLLTRPASLLGPGEGSFGGTYLTGGILGNRAKNTTGGLKTLLGG